MLWLGASVAGPRSPERESDVLGWPPELVADPERDLDERGLLFGLGAVLYRLATGRAPFARDTPLETMRAVVRDKPLNPREIVPSIPLDFVRFLAGLLEKEPEKRFSDFDQAFIELRAVRDLAAVDAPPPRMAVRGWVKAAALRSTDVAGPVYEEVTSELRLPLATDEGPASER